MTATASVTRSKEGVPVWDGTPSSFEEYSELCQIFEQSTPFHKRYLAGPRLLGELQGAARRHVTGKPATWLSTDNGVSVLLRHLRACLGKPQITELTEHLNRYFRQGRRKPQESMNEYIARKCEVYLRSCQAMQRVAPYHRETTKEEPRDTAWRGQWGGYGSRPGGSRRESWDSTATRSEAEEETAAPVQAAAPTLENAEDHQGDRASEANRDDWWRNNAWTWTTQPWWQSGYSYWNDWGYASSRNWGNWSTTGGSQSGESLSEGTLPHLLPEFVQGWYLLQDAGLSNSEKNMIMTAIQNDFSVQRVAQELRTQYGDIEHRRAETGSRHSSYWGEGPEEDEEEQAPDEEGFAVEELDEEGKIMWAEAEAEVHQAWAAVQVARRTLKEARAKQSAVKLSRKYFRPNSGAGYKPRDDSQMECLACGKKGHRAANCPNNTASRGSSSSGPKQSAPFVCFTDQALSAQERGEPEWSTKEAVKNGFAVIDGGATRTLGSVEAIQRVMDLNQEQYGSSRIQSVNVTDRPTFGFGNSTEDQCASTVELGISAGDCDGRLTIHALNRGETPILLSVATLRALKAVIDFEQDLVCFRALNTSRLLQLRRSTTGHQLIPLTKDLYEEALSTSTPVPSLRDLVQPSAE